MTSAPIVACALLGALVVRIVLTITPDEIDEKFACEAVLAGAVAGGVFGLILSVFLLVVRAMV